MTAVLQEQSRHLSGAAGPLSSLPIEPGERAAATGTLSPCGEQIPERPQERRDGGARWQLPERYEYRRLLGSGSYGVVCEASDVHHARALVAIKRIPRVLEHVGDGKRILREISILSKLGRSAYVVELLDVLIPGDSETFHELYLVMEHAGVDLRAFELHRHASFASGERVVKKLLRDLLLGLSHLHESGVFHRDLKPANCLVQRVPGGLADSCDEALGWRLKICDLGHARAVGSELSARDMHPASHAQAPSRHTTMARSLTCHVATRWYRAPELILLQGNYTSAVDVWSAGCIAAELFRLLPGNAPCASQRGPLLPGNGCFPLSPQGDAEDLEDDSAASESRDQMALILNLVGTPSEEEAAEIAGDGGGVVAKTARRYLRSFPPRAPADLLQLFPASSAEACDLLKNMLRFSPHRRLRVPAALAHEFFEELPPVAEGPSCELPVVSPLDFEAEELDARRLRQLIWHEARGFRPAGFCA